MSGSKFFFSMIIIAVAFFAGYFLLVGGFWTALAGAIGLMFALQLVYFSYVCFASWTEGRRKNAAAEKQKDAVSTLEDKAAGAKLKQHLGGASQR